VTGFLDSLQQIWPALAGIALVGALIVATLRGIAGRPTEQPEIVDLPSHRSDLSPRCDDRAGGG